MKVPKIDKELCVGCGTCASLCPEMFELLPEGKSHVISETGPCDLEYVAESCPVNAIYIVNNG